VSNSGPSTTSRLNSHAAERCGGVSYGGVDVVKFPISVRMRFCYFVRHPSPSCLPMSPPNYLTPAGAKQLQDELNRLMSVERPKVVREVAEAAAQGDRSENAEYIYGKKRLREIDRRVQFLTRRLDAAVVVRAEELGGDVVRFGAIVEIRDEDGQQKTYTLVGPDESDPVQGKLSFQSPLGQALMKRKVGDVVLVKRPAGEIELTIVALRFRE
jgi:transcription elongation factor GreB